MAPKLKKTDVVSIDLHSVVSSDTSLVSNSNSLLLGSVASASAQAPLKVSKTIVRDRSIVFWTPVMIWPLGFLRAHKKETIEYKSDSCLHNRRYPLVTLKSGGIIIDLQITEVERQISELLDVNERNTDEQLCNYLDNLSNKIRGGPRKQEGKHKFNLLSSVLL